MEIGDKVEIIKCNKIPILVGKEAEIVELQPEGKHPIVVKVHIEVKCPHCDGILKEEDAMVAFSEYELKLAHPTEIPEDIAKAFEDDENTPPHKP